MNGSLVLLLGLSYKKNTGDARESPAQRVAELLISRGVSVHAVDPYVVESHVDPRVIRAELTATELAAADAVILLTDHDEFDVDLITAHARYLLDCRGTARFAEGVETL